MSGNPEAGKDYPVRLGRSILEGGDSRVRSHFMMRFPNMTESSACGALSRKGDAVEVTKGNITTRGCLQDEAASGKMHDYFFIFHEGTIWLERCANSIHNMKDEGPVAPPITTAPIPPETAPSAPHDEWNQPDFAVSPVTQASASSSEDGAESVTSNSESGSDSSDSYDTDSEPDPSPPTTLAHKSLAAKTLPTARESTAGKSLPAAATPVAAKTVAPERGADHGINSSSSDDSDTDNFTDTSSVE